MGNTKLTKRKKLKYTHCSKGLKGLKEFNGGSKLNFEYYVNDINNALKKYKIVYIERQKKLLYLCNNLIIEINNKKNSINNRFKVHSYSNKYNISRYSTLINREFYQNIFKKYLINIIQLFDETNFTNIQEILKNIARELHFFNNDNRYDEEKNKVINNDFKAFESYTVDDVVKPEDLKNSIISNLSELRNIINIKISDNKQDKKEDSFDITSITNNLNIITDDINSWVIPEWQDILLSTFENEINNIKSVYNEPSKTKTNNEYYMEYVNEINEYLLMDKSGLKTGNKKTSNELASILNVLLEDISSLPETNNSKSDKEDFLNRVVLIIKKNLFKLVRKNYLTSIGNIEDLQQIIKNQIADLHKLIEKYGDKRNSIKIDETVTKSEPQTPSTKSLADTIKQTLKDLGATSKPSSPPSQPNNSSIRNSPPPPPIMPAPPVQVKPSSEVIKDDPDNQSQKTNYSTTSSMKVNTGTIQSTANTQPLFNSQSSFNSQFVPPSIPNTPPGTQIVENTSLPTQQSVALVSQPKPPQQTYWDPFNPNDKRLIDGKPTLLLTNGGLEGTVTTPKFSSVSSIKSTSSLYKDGSHLKPNHRFTELSTQGGKLNKNCNKHIKTSQQNQIKHNYKVCSYITDVEGNMTFFDKYVNISKIVGWVNDKKDRLKFKKDDSMFVYGGDTQDKGDNDVRFVNLLLKFKEDYPDRVIFIIGNRDANKLRFPSELFENYTDEKAFLKKYNNFPYWGEKESRVTLKNYLKKNNFKLNIKNRLKYILKHTMGCKDDSFERRRRELSIILKKDINSVKDEDVVSSFLNSVMPIPKNVNSSNDNYMLKYLINGKIAHIFGKHIFVHGSINEKNIGYVPKSKENIEDINIWVDKLNQWFHKELIEYIKNPKYGGISKKRKACSIIDYSIPSVSATTNKSVVYSDNLKDGNGYPKNKKVIKQLNKSGIYSIISGHKPHGDCPLVIRDKNLIALSADISYSNANYLKEKNKISDDIRGKAVCEVLLYFNGDIKVHGILANNRKYNYIIKNSKNKKEEKLGKQCSCSRSDSITNYKEYIGMQLNNKYWVKNVIKDKFLISFGKGFDIFEKWISLKELKQLLK